MSCIAGCKRVITQKLWDDAGVSNLDLSQVPQRFEMQDHPCGDQITAMKSNLADLWVEDADLDLGFDTMLVYHPKSMYSWKYFRDPDPQS